MYRLTFVLAACADPSVSPSVTPGDPAFAVTPSLERETYSMRPVFVATAIGGETRISAELFDHLRESEAIDPSIQLDPDENLVAVIGTTRIALTEERYRVPGYDTQRVRYVATVASDDPGSIAIDFDRADGTVAHSTIPVFAPFSLASRPAHEVAYGDHLAFSIAPAPAEDRFGVWSAWCNATPTAVIDDVNYRSLYVDPSGAGSLQMGQPLRGETTPCDAQLRLSLQARGAYDPAFHPGGEPIGNRAIDVGIHLYF